MVSITRDLTIILMTSVLEDTKVPTSPNGKPASTQSTNGEALEEYISSKQGPTGL